MEHKINCLDLALREKLPFSVSIFTEDKNDMIFNICLKSQEMGLEINKEASDIFNAIKEIRLELEQHNIILICNASRKDMTPTSLGVNMGRGFILYKFEDIDNDDFSNRYFILESTDEIDKLVSLEEQEKFYKKWIEKPKTQKQIENYLLREIRIIDSYIKYSNYSEDDMEEDAKKILNKIIFYNIDINILLEELSDFSICVVIEYMNFKNIQDEKLIKKLYYKTKLKLNKNKLIKLMDKNNIKIGWNKFWSFLKIF